MPRLLVTEDDPIIAADLEDRLLDAGYTVLLAHDSATALALAGECPDLALMDINLGAGPDGIDTAAALRERYPELPIIFLTSNSDMPTFERARTTKPQGFLSKPFRGRDLLNAVTLAIDRPVAPPSAHTPIPPDEPEGGYTDRIFLQYRERMVRVMTQDILYLAAEDYTCRVVTRDREYLVTKTLKKFMEELPPSLRMIRIHRSYAVNLDEVTEIGEIYVYLNEHRVPVSRRQRDDLLRRT